MGEAITIKEAVAKAKTNLMELYAGEELSALALEAIEKVAEEDRSVWVVTFGFFRYRNVRVEKTSNLTSVLEYIKPPVAEIENRVYKTVFIDADTGEFLKMNMRQVS